MSSWFKCKKFHFLFVQVQTDLENDCNNAPIISPTILFFVLFFQREGIVWILSEWTTVYRLWISNTSRIKPFPGSLTNITFLFSQSIYPTVHHVQSHLHGSSMCIHCQLPEWLAITTFLLKLARLSLSEKHLLWWYWQLW